jgi:hypothetical protein
MVILRATKDLRLTKKRDPSSCLLRMTARELNRTPEEKMGVLFKEWSFTTIAIN